MERILPWLALLVAVTVAVVAVVELDNRSEEDDRLAIPTFVQPSPTTSPLATDATARPRATPARTDRAAVTPRGGVAETAPAPEPTQDETTEPRATPARTATPPRTPTPAPPITAGPVDKARGATPRTGGGAVGPGLLIAAFALLARAGVGMRARSY